MAGFIGPSISITENIFHAGNAKNGIYFSAVNTILWYLQNLLWATFWLIVSI